MQLTGLEGRTALVTGAARGIGRSISEALANSGTRIVGCDIVEDTLRKTCMEIASKGGKILPITADITSASDRKRMIDQALAKFGAIDFLINNAGMHIPTEAVNVQDDEMLKVMQVNFLAMFSLSRDVGIEMIKRKAGRIVNMGSVSGQGAGATHVAYCASKAAVEAMTRSLSMEWAVHNVLVNTVAPGFIWTDLNKRAMENDKQLYNDCVAKIPLHHFGGPEDIANMVAFLCSTESKYITGHIYYVDGGTLTFH